MPGVPRTSHEEQNQGSLPGASPGRYIDYRQLGRRTSTQTRSFINYSYLRLPTHPPILQQTLHIVTMHFSSTSKNIHLDLDGGFWLCCEIQSALPDMDGEPRWNRARFPLHDHFSVLSDTVSTLRYGGSGYSLLDPNHLDRDHVVLTGGTILRARVKSTLGHWMDTSMCLDFFLTNMGGMLVCSEPYVASGLSSRLRRPRLTVL